MKYRIINAIKIGWWAFKNPASINGHNLKIVSDLIELIFKVAREDRPIMSRIAYIHPVEGSQAIVSLWAGPSMQADPYDRITELKKEIEILKDQLILEVNKNQNDTR